MTRKPFNYMLNIDLFNTQIMISYDEPEEVVKSNLMAYELDEDFVDEFIGFLENQSAATSSFDGQFIVIGIKKCEDRYKCMGNIAHESFHAAHYVIERVGIQFEMDVSDEVIAYLIGYISKSIYQKLKF